MYACFGVLDPNYLGSGYNEIRGSDLMGKNKTANEMMPKNNFRTYQKSNGLMQFIHQMPHTTDLLKLLTST